MRSLFDLLAKLIVRQPVATLLVVVLVSAFALLGHLNPRLLARILPTLESKRFGPPSLVSEDSQRRNGTDPDTSPISLANSDAVLVFKSKDFFNPQTVAALRATVRRLESLPQVDRILWIDRVPILNIFGLPQPLLPQKPASQMRYDQARNKAHEHPLIGGQLLSEDGQTMLMLVTYNRLFVFTDEDATTLLSDTARDALKPFDDLEIEVQLTGTIPSAIAALTAHEQNQQTFQIIGYSMIFVMALILFQGLRAILIVALAPAMGVFWTTGFIQMFDYGNNPLVDVIVPILVSLVGLTDGVHLMVKIRKNLASGIAKEPAAFEGLKEVGPACFLTSLTTAIGFGSLLLADSLWVQQFATSCVIGVVCCFLSVIFMIPLACLSPLGNGVHVGLDKSLVDRNLGRVSDVVRWSISKRRTISLISIGLTLGLGLLSTTLKPDQRRQDGLPADAEATIALQHVDRAFQGLEFAEVQVRWPEQTEEGDPEILQVIASIDDIVSKEPLLGRGLSIKNLIDAQPGEGPLEERMSLIGLLPPPLKNAFFDEKSRTAKLSFRVQDLGIAKFGPVFQRVEEQLKTLETKHPGFKIQLKGNAVWRWRNLYQIVVDLATSLGTASVIILIVLTCVFRSLRLGLISIVPNLFPLVLTAAFLVFAGYNLEVVMVCSFTICLGIAVDDTIHFLTRYQEEQKRCDSNEDAILRAFTGVGSALIMTTGVLVAGFTVVTLSNSRDHHIFAVMGAITIAAALFCDLVFLPALLARFGKQAIHQEANR